MKLRNKKTGEIVEVESCNSTTGTIGLFFAEGRECDRAYSSLAELCEEWEDYKEPKNFWFIDEYSPACGVLAKNYNPDFWRYDEYHIDKLKQIGNYFSSKEEAELAVEKLKALAQAKRDGLSFSGWYYNDDGLVILANTNKIDDSILETLFGVSLGGEE